MTRREWRRICLAGLIAAAAVSGGCNDLFRRSVRDGVFTFISGGISSTFDQGGGVNSLLNDLFSGALFGTGGTSATGGAGQ